MPNESPLSIASTPLPAPIRLGYHGSALVAHRILRLAEHDESQAVLIPYDIAAPFRALREGELDVMIVKFGLREPDLAHTTVLTWDARAAAMRAGHPLAARESLSIEELADYDAFERPGALPDYIWDEVVPLRTPAGRPIRRRHRVTDIPSLMAVIMESNTVHPSLASLADVAPPGVRIVPIHDLPPAPVALAWCRAAQLPGHVVDFITAAEAGARR